MIVVDAPLIDRVFQPIVDWLGRSCFDIARFFSDGGLILIAIDLITSIIASSTSVNNRIFFSVATFICFGALVACRWSIAGYERAFRPGMMNEARIRLMPARLFCLTIWLIDSYTEGYLFVIGYALSIAGMYFASCTNRPIVKYQPLAAHSLS